MRPAFPRTISEDARAEPSGAGGTIGLSSLRTLRAEELHLSSLFEDEHFRIVPETMVDGLIVIDSAGLIRYVNPACERLFKYGRGELLGSNVSMLMPRRIAVDHDGYLARHRETRVKRIIGVGRELTGLTSQDEEFPMYLSVGEAQIDGETVFVGIIYDLSEKKRAEETILHHQKLDAIGQLSGGIAHDFNNILSVIGGNLEMIGNLDLPPAARRAVVRAQEAAGRAARITQRLLAFARKQPLTRQTLDLNAALNDLSDMLRRALGETIDVRMHLSPGIGPVEADIDQFETAILNLAVNARDAMPGGGAVLIETAAFDAAEDPRASMDVPPGRYVRVCVSDTGSGMTPDVRARAMEPFFTTKDVGAGTGLGLSMVYGFLKQLGGHARIYSEPAQGTRVSLFFPRADANAATSPGAASGEAPRGQGETILVVEDDMDVRLVTVSRLESLGYRVRTAGDGKSALAAMEHDPAVALALLDVVMPGGMDGHQLAAEFAARWPQVKLVLTSGYSERMAAQGRGDLPFIPKPSSREEVAQTIRATLDG